MPAKSKQQYKFMKAIQNGSIKAPGLSKNKAKEFTDNISYDNLPKRINPVASKELKKNPVDYEKSAKFMKIKKSMGI